MATVCKLFSLSSEERVCVKASTSPSIQLGSRASTRAPVSSPAPWPGSHAAGGGQGVLNALNGSGGSIGARRRGPPSVSTLLTGRVWVWGVKDRGITCHHLGSVPHS